MDFPNRNAQPQATGPNVHAGVAQQTSAKRSNRSDQSKWARIISVIAAAVVVLVLVALIVFLAFGNNGTDEDKYVNTGKLQAVFLNTGQVYFGNVKTLNSKYFVLTNIYYLQTSNSGSSSNSSNANTSVSLVKLGCELHAPYDQMVINAQEVTFWENLQSDGQVAKAVATFEQQNPNGQKCADQSTSSGSTSGSVQSAGGNNGSSSTSSNGSSSTTGNTNKP